MNELSQLVIDLHNIARQIEQAWGSDGDLARDIRNCADRLNSVISNTTKKQEERIE